MNRSRAFHPLTRTALAATIATLWTTTGALAADTVLSGAVTSSTGEKMAGVTVSAKADGQTITTSVFTDEAGAYYFPALPAAKYRVWAQALTFEIARGEVDLGAKKRQDFKLEPAKDYVRQLPGHVMIDSLPDETDADKRMKQIVRNACTGCHTPSYTLQHTFDEAGWNAIIDLMKRVNVSGVVQADRINGLLDHHQKELAAYLARARGPGESAMKIKLPPRPTGEAARVVFREYDVPPDIDQVPYKVLTNDGSDWSLGTPSRIGSLVHDAYADGDGNLWFTSNVPNRFLTIGRIDAKTGEFKALRVAGQNGLAANTHGMKPDSRGNIWFDVNVGPRGLGRLDPKTQKIQVFVPPQGISPTGGAVTVDVDPKDKVWASSPTGALRFDPETETFTEYKSLTFKTANGNGVTYGAAVDRNGNGWWAEMILDTIGRADAVTGQVTEIKLPPMQPALDRIRPEDKAFYAGYVQPDFNVPFPWAQGPRRMGTDKNDDVLWIGNSWGGNLAKINTKTMDVSFVALPGNGSHQPYHIAVDSQHNAWLNLWTTDRILRLDPKTQAWTAFDLPTRGTEARYISLTETNGRLQIVMPYSRTSKVAVMTLRSDADMAAAKAVAQ